MSPERSPEVSPAALIVGCGRIAGGFNQRDETLALTHAASYRRLGIPIAACCDSDPARARAFAQRWGVPRHGSKLDDLIGEQPLLLSVCTPAESQADVLGAAMAHQNVVAALVEKPCGGSLLQTTEIERQAAAWRRPVLVNYFRAFTPFYQAFAERVNADAWGVLRRATIHYGGTLESHACHALERLIFSFGAPKASESLTGDPAAPLVRLSFEAGAEALLVPARGPGYSIFEMDHFFARGRVRIVDGERRVELFEAGDDPDFPGYRSLRPADPKLPPLSHELHESVAALVTAARSGRDDSGTLARAVAVARVVDTVTRPDA